MAAAQQLPYAWPEVPNKPAAAAAASDQTMLMADAKAHLPVQVGVHG